VQLYRSTTASAVPSAGNLTDGELAINTTDEKLYFKNASGTVKLLAANVMPVANGGTGATTASTALTNLGAVAKAGDTMTGVLAFTAGTVSAPGITFSGDTNTGIFSPAADTIAFTEGGVESMRINSSGNVGIGTSSPGAKLAVQNDRAATALSQIWSVYNGASFENDVTLAYTGSVTNFGNFQSNPLAFLTNNTERMRIDSSGNVGIGTSSPSALLHVNGNSKFGALVTTGLGVSTGDAGLEVGGERSGNGNSIIDLHAAAGTDFSARLLRTSGANGQFEIINSGTGGLVFATNSSERARIDSSGNVGIGTSVATAARLVVTSPANSPSLLLTDATQSTLTIKHEATNLLTYEVTGAAVQRWVGNSVERMRINSSGNVGIGTSSPSAYGLTVSKASGAAGMQIASGANNSDFVMNGIDLYVSNNVAGTIQFYINSAERARITANGRIGIKTSVPTSLLTISTPGDTENITKLTINGYGDFRGYGCIMQPNNDTNCVPFLFTNAAGTVVGSISTNASGTSFTTSSDYRLKHDVQPLTTGLATIAALKPSTYKWNADDSHGEGFIAHELAEHIPHAVTGEKDAVNADGSIKPQAVDYSKIVVHLVAALQELKAESDALKARIATLEARQ
jgi:hypothetical protein